MSINICPYLSVMVNLICCSVSVKTKPRAPPKKRSYGQSIPCAIAQAHQTTTIKYLLTDRKKERKKMHTHTKQTDINSPPPFCSWVIILCWMSIICPLLRLSCVIVVDCFPFMPFFIQNRLNLGLSFIWLGPVRLFDFLRSSVALFTVVAWLECAFQY